MSKIIHLRFILCHIQSSLFFIVFLIYSSNLCQNWCWRNVKTDTYISTCLCRYVPVKIDKFWTFLPFLCFRCRFKDGTKNLHWRMFHHCVTYRVTRWVCENLTQDVAQSIFCQNWYIPFSMEKQLKYGLYISGTSVIYYVNVIFLPKVNNSLKGKKSQSGHPDYIHKVVCCWFLKLWVERLTQVKKVFRNRLWKSENVPLDFQASFLGTTPFCLT
jgi:hypothetical protein